MTPSEATPTDLPTPATDESPTPKKKRRWGRRTALAAVIGVAGLAALPTLLSTSWLNDAIRAWLRDNVNRPVEFASLDISWIDGVTIRDLRISDKDRGAEPMLTAPLVEIDTKLLPLLYREVEIKHFVIHDPVIRIEKNVDGVNADDAIKRKRVKRKRRGGAPDDPNQPDEPDEALVLPRINVPMDVRNATLVFVNEEGREARQGNVQFSGHLSTRDGPTTFDFSASDGPGSGVFAKGTAILFDAEGVLLDADEFEIDVTVKIQNVDAERNHDLVALVLGDSPATGVIDGTLTARTRGSDVDGNIELVVSGVAVGKAVGARDRSTEDLRIQGSFLYADDIVRIDGLLLRGEGLEAYLQLEGDKTALDGEGELHADLDRMQRALAAMGFEIEGLSGRIDGDVRFTSDPSQGIGTLFATNVFVPSPIEGRPPVSLDGSRLDFIVRPTQDGLQVDNARLTLPEFSADARGLIGSGGGLDITTHAAGDLERVIGRLRDLGLVPKDLALAGRIDAEVRTTRPANGGLPGVTIERFDLTGEDVSIRIRGTRTPEGALDFTATGDGDIARLLGAAATGSGFDVGAIRGRFGFSARASGTDNELDVLIERMHLDGDVNLDGSGRLAPNGSLSGDLTANGQVEKLVTLLRRMGFVEGDLPLRGRLAAHARISGTRDRPEVPDARFELTDGPIRATALGKLGADGAIDATIDATAGLNELLDLARAMGKIETAPRPGGELTLHAVLGGSVEKPAVPEARLAIAGGPIRANATGSMRADGALDATVDATAGLNELLDIARAMGRIETAPKPGGELTVHVVLGGTRTEPVVPDAQVRMTGPLTLAMNGSLDSAQNIKANGTGNGRIQPLLDLVATIRGGESQRLDGTLDGEFSAEGSRDALLVRVPRLDVQSGGAAVKLSGTRQADGAAEGVATVRGALGDMLAIARGLGYGAEYSGTGSVDARMGITTVEGTERLRADVSATLANVNLVRTGEPGTTPGRLNLAGAKLTVDPFTFDRVTRKHDPIAARIELAEARASMAMASGLADGSPLDATLSASGALQPVLDLAAFMTGGDVTQLGGDFTVEARATGTRDKPRIEVPKMTLRSGDLTANVTASVPDERTADLNARVEGDLSRALAIAQMFGKAAGQQATGRMSLTATAKMRDGIATAAFDATATDVVMPDSEDPSAPPMREPRLHISAPSIRYDRTAERVDPFRVLAEAVGARIEGTLSYAKGAIPAGATDPAQNVSVDGTVLLTKEFVANHQALFDETKFERIEGPVRFAGDVSRGLDGAATWTGAFDLRATSITAPYVRVDWLTMKGTIGGGVAEVTQLEGIVNDGSLSGAARFGLVGKFPEHSITIDATDVTIDGELAPLLANVSPLLAVGESGTAAGKAGVTAHLTANGTKSARIKRTMNGNGILRLRDVQVRSSGWVGSLLDVTGMGSLLSIASADVPFTVADGKVTTSDLPINAVGMGMKLGGEVTMDGDLDYRLAVKPGNDSLSKYATLFDADGYLPLRLKGDASNPSLKLPSLSDVVTGGSGLGGLLDKLRGKDEKKDDPEKDEPEKPRRKRNKKDKRDGGADDPPPPPPPR